jgi:hypothetical protein
MTSLVDTLLAGKRETRMQGISADMTVREALRLLSPAHQINLQHWAAELDLPLREFHLGHIRTYESERLRTESRHTINAEVSTLLDLLAAAGVGDEIRRHYLPLREPEELSPEERASLPERVLHYIEKLEGELKDHDSRNDLTENRLRKANWARWTR